MTDDTSPTYVVVTPAFNEEKYIHHPIESMLRQTILPFKWIIVDDGSQDGTAQIIEAVAKQHDWIDYHYINKNPGQTYYSSNVYAILKGIKLVEELPYSHLAILDADIDLCDDYYERIFEKFAHNEALGIATGTYLEQEGNDWVAKRTDPKHTPKAIQVFTRECYEKCNGYIPFKYGGEDTGIAVMARMNGWKTWSFDDILVKHYRAVGTGDGRSLLRGRFRLGMTDYCIGTHPFFMILKSIKRMFKEKPYCLSGVVRLIGYLSGGLRSLERQLPEAAINYLREEQMLRLTKPQANNWKLE
jgi:poly-beta-1,6-N-acetyl-D-glucosamine synthase